MTVKEVNIDESLLDKLVEENIKKQSFKLDEILNELDNKWTDNKYYFDKEEAQNIFTYVSLLKNDKGKSRKFTILRFQFEIIAEILCVKDKKTKLRRFTEAHINVGRKNGKSFLVGIIMSYLFFCQKNIFGALFIITGNTTKQAGELYNTFKCFVNSNKALKRRCKITDSKKEIIRKDNGNKLIVLSNDGGGADSYADYCFACDEIHEYKSDEIYGKLKTGQGTWDDPLAITLTTASSGEDPYNLEMQLYGVAKNTQEGKAKEDESFYYRIYEAEKDCEVDNVEEWFKANPALGLFRKVKDLKQLCERIPLMPLQENMFRRMFLNQHVTTDHIEGAINMELFKKACKDINIEDFKGYKCYGGLDLASKHDICGFVVVFYNDDDDKYYVFPYLYTARDTIKEREDKDKNPYSKWVKDGELIAVDGKYIKLEPVVDKMIDIKNDYNLEMLGYDRYGSHTIQTQLEENFDYIPLGQGTVTMNQFIKDFENLLVDERIVIQNSDLFTYMASNCVAVINEQNEIKYSKKKSKFIIDGIIAMLMALGLAIQENDVEHYDALAELEKANW